MFWLIVGAVIVVGFALAWWSSGRSKGTLRMDPQEAIRRTQGEVATDRASHQGPNPVP
ncbi:hypothetical protein [Nocardioides marmorisolisilvae]|uniref:hypothetical protein n=1 Tax=Nocardioides marmorisolisilvae TaxID=1542737 RepID=UPI00160CFCDB|nr:hypothetical protein [Nocardioides marmorisolisilvae]